MSEALPWIEVSQNATPDQVEEAFNEVSSGKSRVKFQDETGKDVAVLIRADEYHEMQAALARGV